MTTETQLCALDMSGWGNNSEDWKRICKILDTKLPMVAKIIVAECMAPLRSERVVGRVGTAQYLFRYVYLKRTVDTIGTVTTVVVTTDSSSLREMRVRFEHSKIEYKKHQIDSHKKTSYQIIIKKLLPRHVIQTLAGMFERLPLTTV